MKYDKKIAKLDMLRSLKDEMMKEDDVGLKGKLGDMKKVTVMSDSEEGLEEGMSKAQEILKKKFASEDDKEEESEDEMEEESEDSDKVDMMKEILKLKEQLGKSK